MMDIICPKCGIGNVINRIKVSNEPLYDICCDVCDFEIKWIDRINPNKKVTKKEIDDIKGPFDLISSVSYECNLLIIFP